MTIHVDIDDKSVDEFLDENKDTLFNMLKNAGSLEPNKKMNNLINKEMHDEIHEEVLQVGDIINIDGRFYILEDE